MKHKHYDMIVAKAANMNLIQFVRFDKEWIVQGRHENLNIAFEENYQYFLCLPKHKDVVLNILNGGNGEVNYGEFWQDCNVGQPIEWCPEWWCMNDNCESRIKQKKEKRWIAAKGDAVSGIYKTKRELELMYATTSGVQFIEIEVEI